MNKKLLGLLFLVIFGQAVLLSQNASNSPYQLEWKKEAPILATGMGLSISGYALERTVNSRSELELGSLSFQSFLKPDNGATDNFSTSAADASDWLFRSSALLPLTLLADANIRQDAGKIAVLGSESLLLTYGLTNLTKATVRRDRPFVFNDEVPIEKKLTSDSQLSFFSGHTSATATATFFTAKVWSDYHPDSKWKPVVWTAAAIIPAATGYFRVKAGKHYFSDVATGYAVGALVGYFVPHLHKIERGEKRKLRLSTSSIGEVPVFNLKYRF